MAVGDGGVEVFVTSAFCKDGAGGNRAGVVIDRPDLGVEDKMAISAALGYSETAFVTASSVADFCLEYFTPTDEVPLCGHATIATFATLLAIGRIGTGCHSIQTKSGVLGVETQASGLIMMEQNSPQYLGILEAGQLAGCMGCEVGDLGAPIQIITTGLKDIILPVRDVTALARLSPDFSALAALSEELGVVGVHAFACAGAPQGVDAVCRNFAPLYGIDEESATGTSSCALASYLARYARRKSAYVFEQGYSLGQPSRIEVSLGFGDAHGPDAAIESVFVGGHGRLVERLCLPR